MSKGSDYDIDKFDLEQRKRELIKQGEQAIRGFGAYNHPIIPTMFSTTTTWDHRSKEEREVEDTTYEEVSDNPFPIKELKARLKELAPVDIDYEEVKPKQLSDGKQD